MSQRIYKSPSIRRNSLPLQICKVLAVAGGVTLVAVMPGLTKLLIPLMRSNQSRYQNRVIRNRVTQTFWRLSQRGLVQRDTTGLFTLTSKGEQFLARYTLQNTPIPKPKKWDGKWRLVAFDISERRKSVREYLRNILKRLGFVQLQASLWIHPYDCEELIALMRTDLHLASALRYMIVEKIDDDHFLRKRFGLPLAS